MQSADLSFDPGHLLVAQLAMRQDLLKDGRAQRAALDLVMTNANTLPGVRDVSPVLALPFVGAGGGIDGRLSRHDQGREGADKNPIVHMELAAPNYFTMLGVPLLRGRAFVDQDREGATPVIIVSNAVANYYWPGDAPIGKRLDKYVVVGVVADTRYRELRSPRATVYFPLQQSPFGSLVLRRC